MKEQRRKLSYKAVWTSKGGWKVLINELPELYDTQGRLVCV